MDFRLTGEKIELSGYFENPDNMIVNILRKDYLGWIFIENKGDPGMNMICCVKKYNYKPEKYFRLSCDFDEQAIKDHFGSLDKNNLIELKIIIKNDGTNLQNNDIIYKLEVIDENEEPDIEWWNENNNLKTYEQYVFENRMLNKGQMDVAFDKAKEYLNNIHKKINEEHIIDFMIGYFFNNYGVDFSHGKDVYRFVKHYVHYRLKKKMNRYNENI